MAIYNMTYIMEHERDKEFLKSLQEDFDLLNESIDIKKYAIKIKEFIELIRPIPELNQYIEDIEYAQYFLYIKTDIKAKTSTEDMFHLVNRLLEFLASFFASFNISMMIVTGPILISTILRNLITILCSNIIANTTDQQIYIIKGKNIIRNYDYAISNCKNNKIKEQLIEQRDKVQTAVNIMMKK